MCIQLQINDYLLVELSKDCCDDVKRRPEVLDHSTGYLQECVLRRLGPSHADNLSVSVCVSLAL